MERLYKLAEASNIRFPDGVNPYQMATRLLEECGEVADQINHFEDSGLKRQKRGEPVRADFANELRQAITELIKLAAYYGLRDELEESIDKALKRVIDEGLIK